jgi:hypothetical protein
MDNTVSLKEHIDLKFDHLLENIQNLEKNFVTKLEMRNSLDELVADWIKKEASISEKVLKIDNDFRPIIRDLKARKDDRRKFNLLIIGTFTTSAISFIFTILSRIFGL